ncbi:MAG: hypothetical protein AB1424_01410 [Thermodesulfobacteriota bacterium]
MRNMVIIFLLAALITVPGISAAQQRGEHPMMGKGPMAGCPWMPDYMGRMHGMMGDMRGMMNMPMTPEQQKQMMDMMSQMGTMMHQMCGPQAAQMKPQHDKQMQEMQQRLDAMKKEMQKKQ